MTNWVVVETRRRIRPEETVVVSIYDGITVQVDAYGNVTNAYGDGIVGVTEEHRREATMETEGLTFETGEYVMWSPE